MFLLDMNATRENGSLTGVKILKYKKGRANALPFLGLTRIKCAKPSGRRGLPTGTAAVALVVALCLAGTTAFRATLGFVFESLFLVESLLAFGEDEFCVAILTGKCFISHCEYTSLFNIWNESFPDTTLQRTRRGCNENESIHTVYFTGRTQYNMKSNHVQVAKHHFLQIFSK